jgi:hypothetical protein
MLKQRSVLSVPGRRFEPWPDALSSSLLDSFATIPDPRRAQGKMDGLAPVLLVSVLAGLSGATYCRRVHDFIDSHLSRLTNPRIK